MDMTRTMQRKRQNVSKLMDWDEPASLGMSMAPPFCSRSRQHPWQEQTLSFLCNGFHAHSLECEFAPLCVLVCGWVSPAAYGRSGPYQRADEYRSLVASLEDGPSRSVVNGWTASVMILTGSYSLLSWPWWKSIVSVCPNRMSMEANDDVDGGGRGPGCGAGATTG